MSMGNYHHTLRNIPEDRRFHVLFPNLNASVRTFAMYCTFLLNANLFFSGGWGAGGISRVHSTYIVNAFERACIQNITKDNIKMDLQEVGCGSMDWFELGSG